MVFIRKVNLLLLLGDKASKYIVNDDWSDNIKENLCSIFIFLCLYVHIYFSKLDKRSTKSYILVK